jgi:hypothetical protein
MRAYGKAYHGYGLRDVTPCGVWQVPMLLPLIFQTAQCRFQEEDEYTPLQNEAQS